MIGTIQSISGHPASGIRTIHFSDGTSTYVESGHGMRQLASAFNVEHPGEFEQKVVGQTIEYETDDFGCMSGFSPIGADNG